jgi:hypothetical protein
MKKFISVTNDKGFAKIVLEVDDGGVACFAFERKDSAYPEWDYWEQDLDTAKAMCLDLWGVPPHSWGEAPA